MSTAPARQSQASRVQSVERAAALLRAVAEGAGGSTTVAALAGRCGLNRATAWRILQTLEEQRLVAPDRTTGGYAIGPGLVELVRGSGLEGLIRSARPVLTDLADRTGETAALAVMRGAALTYVHEVTPAAVVAAAWRGREVPLHATSTGKVVLAFSRSVEPAGPLTRYTRTTVTKRDALARELARVRRDGYAVCRGEFEATAYGVSAPVISPEGDLRAVVSIWGPAGRLTESRFPELGALAVEAAAALADSPRRDG